MSPAAAGPSGEPSCQRDAGGDRDRRPDHGGFDPLAEDEAGDSETEERLKELQLSDGRDAAPLHGHGLRTPGKWPVANEIGGIVIENV